jgi:hypothetical protein
MKAFRFRLERVLFWRETQLRLAEAKAEQLKSCLLRTDDAMAELVEHRAAALAAVRRDAIVSGADLGAMDRSRVWAVREEKKLAARRMELQQSVAVQNRTVSEARRAVKLVERLRARQYESWKAETDHEMVDLAGESAIAQWRRLNGC